MMSKLSSSEFLIALTKLGVDAIIIHEDIHFTVPIKHLDEFYAALKKTEIGRSEV